MSSPPRWLLLLTACSTGIQDHLAHGDGGDNCLPPLTMMTAISAGTTKKCQPPCKNSKLKSVNLPVKFGKLPSRPLTGTNTAGQTLSRLLFLTDSNSGHHFFIDTSAKVSCIPLSCGAEEQTGVLWP